MAALEKYDAKLTFDVNKKKRYREGGSKADENYQKYKFATTLKEAKTAGASNREIKRDIGLGDCVVTGYPDLNKHPAVAPILGGKVRAWLRPTLTYGRGGTGVRLWDLYPIIPAVSLKLACLKCQLQAGVQGRVVARAEPERRRESASSDEGSGSDYASESPASCEESSGSDSAYESPIRARRMASLRARPAAVRSEFACVKYPLQAEAQVVPLARSGSSAEDLWNAMVYRHGAVRNRALVRREEAAVVVQAPVSGLNQ